MKRRMTALLTALLLVLALCVPAMAETDYGLIYDETEMLGDLSYQGEEMLPELSEELGFELRVDVLTQISYDSIRETSAGIYSKYGYGYGENHDGATLTLLLRGTEDGAYTLSETDWCVYTLLDAARGSAQELSDVVRDAVSPYMAQRAWSGEDMTMSATALSQVMGYLVAENGIFLLGIPLMTAGAVWFELTLLLDIFVAVFVMGIAINHISHTFESIDVGFHDLRD